MANGFQMCSPDSEESKAGRLWCVCVCVPGEESSSRIPQPESLPSNVSFHVAGSDESRMQVLCCTALQTHAMLAGISLNVFFAAAG